MAAHTAGGPALGGVLAERRHLDRAGLGAGQGRRGAGRGDHDGVDVGASTAPKNRRPAAPAARRMPATPPPERPCGRTAAAAKCSSWASVVTKQSASSPVASSTAPTTSSPSSSRMTSHVVPVGEDLGVDPLDDAVPGAEREAGPLGRSAVSASARSPRLERQELADRGAALQVRVRWRWRAARAGRARRAGAAGRGWSARRPRPGRWRGPRRPPRRAWRGQPPSPGGSRVERAGQQAAGGEEDEARVVGDLERDGRAVTAGPGRLQQHGAPRGAVASWRPRPARRRRPSRSSASSARIASSSAMVLPQLVALLLQLDAGELGQPAQRHVEDVVGLRPRRGRRPAISRVARPLRRRRWSGSAG